MANQFENRTDVLSYILVNQIQHPQELCDTIFKQSIEALPKKVKNNLIKHIDTTQPYPHYNLYKDHFLLPSMITRYFKNVTKAQVDKALILQIGKYFEDGFSGLQVKAVSYTSDYVIELTDGERGTLFIKRYNHFPSYDELLMDSLLECSVHEPTEYFPFSIMELFN